MSRAHRVEVHFRVGKVGKVEGRSSRSGAQPAGRGECPDDAVGGVPGRERVPRSLEQDAQVIGVRLRRERRGRRLGAWPSQVCFKSVYYGATTAWPSPVLSGPPVQRSGLRRKSGVAGVSAGVFTLIAYLLMIGLGVFVVAWHGKCLSTLALKVSTDEVVRTHGTILPEVPPNLGYRWRPSVLTAQIVRHVQRCFVEE